MKRLPITFFFLFIALISFSQSTKNWHWKDYEKDSVHGISLQKAYQLLASYTIQPSPIIVAVIDGGMDTNHIELKEQIIHNVLFNDNSYNDNIAGKYFRKDFA